MKQIVTILLLFISTAAWAKTYEIVEIDFVESARTYAGSDEFRQRVVKERDRLVESIMNREGTYLPPASDNETYSVGYSYTLQQDIPKVDRAGNIIGVLYPQGYSFNPLLYLPSAPPPMIIFSPCDDAERAFAADYIKQLPSYMLVSTRCKLKDTKGYSEPIYQVQPEMIEKFKLKASVSVVSVDIEKGVFNVQIFKTNRGK